jgi:hypothetical protein
MKKSYKMSNYKNKIKEGGFHNMATLEAELGEFAVNMTYEQKQQLLNESKNELNKLELKEQLDLNPELKFQQMEEEIKRQEQRAANEERQRRAAEEQRNRINSELQTTKSLKDIVDNELNTTRLVRNRLNDELYNEKNKNYIIRNVPLDDYFVKERIKREIKDEILENANRKRRDEAINRLLTPTKTKIVYKSKPSRSKSKPSRSKSKPSRSKSKSKGKKRN